MLKFVVDNYEDIKLWTQRVLAAYCLKKKLAGFPSVIIREKPNVTPVNIHTLVYILESDRDTQSLSDQLGLSLSIIQEIISLERWEVIKPLDPLDAQPEYVFQNSYIGYSCSVRFLGLEKDFTDYSKW